MGVYYNLSKSSIPEVDSRWMMLIVLKVNEVLKVEKTGGSCPAWAVVPREQKRSHILHVFPGFPSSPVVNFQGPLLLGRIDLLFCPPLWWCPGS